MKDLNAMHCVACEGGVSALIFDEADELLAKLKDWHFGSANKLIYKKFEFKNFYKTMSFVNAIAWIANQENHHPDMEVGYNYCLVRYHTHAIDGLSKNDFICAAKIDALS